LLGRGLLASWRMKTAPPGRSTRTPKLQYHPASAGAGQAQGTSRVGSKSVIKLFVAATAGCQGTKNRVFASESAQTHHARTTTHYWHHTDQCYSLGVHWWRLGSRLQLRSSRGGRNGPRTPPKRRSAAGTALRHNCEVLRWGGGHLAGWCWCVGVEGRFASRWGWW